MSNNWKRIRCSKCGKEVSTPVPKETIIRAYIECPECIEKEVEDEANQRLDHYASLLKGEHE